MEEWHRGFHAGHRADLVKNAFVERVADLRRDFEGRFAGNRLILLGPWASRPRTAASRDYDCNHCHMSPLTVRKRRRKEVA
jgi:hypothetical protein